MLPSYLAHASIALLPPLLHMQDKMTTTVTNHPCACNPWSQGGWRWAVSCCCIFLEGNQCFCAAAEVELSSCTMKLPAWAGDQVLLLVSLHLSQEG